MNKSIKPDTNKINLIVCS